VSDETVVAAVSPVNGMIMLVPESVTACVESTTGEVPLKASASP